MMRLFGIRRYFIFLTIGFILSCNEKEVDPVTTSENVTGLKYFRFEAALNPSLFQDISFTKQADFSYAAMVAHDVNLQSIIPTFDYAGEVKQKKLKLVSGKTKSAFPDQFILTFDGKSVIFRINRVYTIPTLYINTADGAGVTSKEEYINCSIQLDSKNLFEDFSTTQTDSAEIRGRGNSTWKYYNKKPYRLKLKNKKSLLGMGAAKSWVLLANYRDPSYFMNAVVFDMARYMEMPYTNSNRFVEVYMDNQYIGMYQLTEQIQQGENRVAIDEQTGVLLNLDLDDGPYYAPVAGDNFYSKVYNLPVAIKHPEGLSADQLNAIRDDFALIEQHIKDKNYTGLSQRLAIKSLIDFLIIQELTRNVELVSPRSMYMYKDGNNLYHFGPVWDFDGGFAFDWASMSTGHNYFGSQTWLMGSGNPASHPGDAYNYLSGFFVNMFAQPEFLAAYKKRWNELQPDLLKFCFQRLDDYALHSHEAMERNAKRWPIGKDYTTEIEKLKNWLTVRAANYTQVIKNY